MKIINLAQIRRVLPAIDLMGEIEQGFRKYSGGHAIVPPVGELLLGKGEVHIKYGCIQDDPHYVIKVASGFYGNPSLGLPSGNGLMLLFSQDTGTLESILLDEGYLTSIRTAVAGAIAAKYLAPAKVKRIGIIGTGTQARLQLLYLKKVVDCDQVLVWGRDREKVERYQTDMERKGFNVEAAGSAGGVLQQCDLVVTTTPSEEPLLEVRDLQKGTHITAVGSDTVRKQELDPEILKNSDLVVADSIEQCLERGEIHQAIRAGKLGKERIMELGKIIAGEAPGRDSDDQVTVADLTGVAVQDMKVASAVYSHLTR